MSNIATKLSEMSSVKSALKGAIASKGVDMTNVPFNNYPEKINEITTGIDESILLDIKQSIENKGVDMSNTSYDEYASKIDEIETGFDFQNATLIEEIITSPSGNTECTILSTTTENIKCAIIDGIIDRYTGYTTSAYVCLYGSYDNNTWVKIDDKTESKNNRLSPYCIYVNKDKYKYFKATGISNNSYYGATFRLSLYN